MPHRLTTCRLGYVDCSRLKISILCVGAAGSFIADLQGLLLAYGFSLPTRGNMTAYWPCPLAVLFNSVNTASAYNAECHEFKSRRSPCFLDRQTDRETKLLTPTHAWYLPSLSTCYKQKHMHIQGWQWRGVGAKNLNIHTGQGQENDPIPPRIRLD